VGDGLPDPIHAAAISQIEAVLARFPSNRRLLPGELSRYGNKFQHGWAITELSDEPTLEFRVLVPGTVPFFPPRIAVDPAPAPLAWPHLEEDGLLCLLPESANISVAAPGMVLATLLEEGRKLVNASLRGENLQDFEDEFTSYWIRWERSKLVVRSFCEPREPSRVLRGWRSTDTWLIAEDAASLRAYSANIFGESILKKMPPFVPVPLLWLPRPMRPSEYPKNVCELRRILQELPRPQELLDSALLERRSGQRLIMLGAASQNGSALAGVLVSEPTGLRDGFSTEPPRQVWLGRYNAAATTGAGVIRLDAEWVHGREQNPEAQLLRAKHVVIVGVGSIGSAVTDLLAKAGVGELTLVDPEAFESANSSRHLVGASSVGENKAKVVGRDIAKRFPHLSVKPLEVSVADLLQPVAPPLLSADLIISATGNWSAESLLNSIWREGQLPPVLYGWTEPFAAAGHALLLMHGQGSLRCIHDVLGKPRLPVTNWQQTTMLRNPSCGGMFQPYGAVELAHVNAAITELAIDMLLQRVSQSTYRVWIGGQKTVQRAGGSWNPSWVSSHGDPGSGARLAEVAFGTGCSECQIKV